MHPILRGLVLIAESMVFMFGGPRPHLYKTQAELDLETQYPIYNLPQRETLTPEQEAKLTYAALAQDQEKIGGDFEKVMGLYPGSPTWRKMIHGEVPRTPEFNVKYAKFEEDITKRVMNILKNNKEYQGITKSSEKPSDKKADTDESDRLS